MAAMDSPQLDYRDSAGRMIALSKGLKRIKYLSTLLGGAQVVFGPPEHIEPSDKVLAWGARPSASLARKFAARHNLPVCFVEDGLLRSVGLGVSDPPLSLMLDDLGLYLDATRPTRLEQFIQYELTRGEAQRAKCLIDLWQRCRVSKYNYQREYDHLPRQAYVLVVDQTLGDASITNGMANSSTFSKMLDSAFDENPDCEVLLKVHPEVMAGRKRGHYDLNALASRQRLTILAEPAHPCSLIENAKCIYVVTSQVGFESLLWGRPVRTFGMPFYAGWGLTVDELPRLARRGPVSLEQLVFAALIRYPTYVDPESGEPSTPERVISWLGLQRYKRGRFDCSIQAFGFSKWKRPFVKDFFAGSSVSFVSRSSKLSREVQTAIWGRKNDAALGQRFGSSLPSVIRIEDGFLRSVGLGADLVRPLSWVQDDLGIYYDATKQSRLEHLLGNAVFDAELLKRTIVLRSLILESGLTKYNVGDMSLWSPPSREKRILLVPGQVESDASIRFGSTSVKTNFELVNHVRSSNPLAYIVYKPHPDVAAKLRDAGRDENDVLSVCDEVIENVSMHTLLSSVDEVHTITSLSGFEALMRGTPVVTYGQPFYAGWGLTTDLMMSDEVRRRRCRVLTLDELVAATLILYPTYVSRRTRQFTTPEIALAELIAWREESPRLPRLRRWLAYITRKM